LKLNGAYQIVVYADVNILNGCINTVKNTEALVVSSMELV